jgi:hypothetical protein
MIIKILSFLFCSFILLYLYLNLNNDKKIIMIDKDIFIMKLYSKDINESKYFLCDENGTLIKRNEVKKNSAIFKKYLSEEIPSIKENLLKNREKIIYSFECEKIKDCEEKIKLFRND